MSKKVSKAVQAAMMNAESDVAPPARARASSFASAVFDLQPGDAPACRALDLDAVGTVADHMAQLAEYRDKLRNTLSSAVSQARRRDAGREFTIEVTTILTSRGITVVGMVRRTA